MEYILIFIVGFVLVNLRQKLQALEARFQASEELTQRLLSEFNLKARPPGGDDKTAPAPVQPLAPSAVRSPVPPSPMPPSSVPRVTPVARPLTGPATPLSSPDQTSLEERLGTRWAVWVGGLALALGGLLLVRYTIEQGYVGPAARIVLGLLFATGLIIAGEWFRRAERQDLIASIPSAHIPGILTAAGTSTAFGTIYAAHALYGFIGPGPTFVLLGAVGIGTMLASALHGPALAGLGLAGAYSAPLLLATSKPEPWALVIYLAVIAGSALWLGGVRAWHWLAGLAVGGAVFWALPLLGHVANGDADWVLAGHLHVVIQLVLAGLYLAIARLEPVKDSDVIADIAGAWALGALTVVALLFLAADHADTVAVVAFTLPVAAILSAISWQRPQVAQASVFAGLVVLAATFAWPGSHVTSDLANLMPGARELFRLPGSAMAMVLFSGLTALGVAAIAALRLWRGRELPAETVGLYAAAATLTPLTVLAVDYLRVAQLATSAIIGLLAVLLAALFAAVADQFHRTGNPELSGSRLATGAFAAAGVAAVCLGLTVSLASQYLVAALALAALATAVITVRKDIPLLGHVVSALALIILARVAWSPRVIGADVGSWPVLNWLLIGYGVPAVAFWRAARILDQPQSALASRIADATAILFAALLAFFELHHALNGGDMLAPTSGHVEQGLLAIVGFAMSYALVQLDLGRTNPVFGAAEIAFGLISAALVVVGLGFAYNPYLSHEPILGPPVFSSLMLGYLLPGLAAAALARAIRPLRPAWYATVTAALSLGLLFFYVTLEVRHLFHGATIGYALKTSGAEHWAYSASWLALGVAFLAYGVVRTSLEARLASAGLVVVSVAKVFLFDLGGLTGFWRALSFIVLGLVLIGIGLVYQNIIFAKPTERGEPGNA